MRSPCNAASTMLTRSSVRSRRPEPWTWHVQRRLVNAKLDATFLLADVEVVTTYLLYHVNRTKLENLLHRFFAPARLDITITDRFGNPVAPREWFEVPLFIIDEAIERIRDGSITEYRYDPARVALVRHDAK